MSTRFGAMNGDRRLFALAFAQKSNSEQTRGKGWVDGQR